MKNTTTLSCGSSSSSGDSLDDISIDGYKRRKLIHPPQRGRVVRKMRSRSLSRHIDDESASSNATSKSTFMDLDQGPKKVGVTTRSGLRLRDR